MFFFLFSFFLGINPVKADEGDVEEIELDLGMGREGSRTGEFYYLFFLIDNFKVMCSSHFFFYPRMIFFWSLSQHRC